MIKSPGDLITLPTLPTTPYMSTIGQGQFERGQQRGNLTRNPRSSFKKPNLPRMGWEPNGSQLGGIIKQNGRKEEK